MNEMTIDMEEGVSTWTRKFRATVFKRSVRDIGRSRGDSEDSSAKRTDLLLESPLKSITSPRAADSV